MPERTTGSSPASSAPRPYELPEARPHIQELSGAWEMAGSAAGSMAGPKALDGLKWIPAAVPGTVAGALRDAGLAGGDDLDALDWWYRTRFSASPGSEEQVTLVAGGLATVAEVYLNGQRVLSSESMFAEHAVTLGSRLESDNEMAICFRALKPLLAGQRRPRARWRTALVGSGNLRFYRTMLLGRAPGFAPAPPVIGPWRPIRLERQRRPALGELTVRTVLDGADGVVEVRAAIDRPLDGAPVEVAVEIEGPTGRRREVLAERRRDGAMALVTGAVRLPAPAPWWPHTHGEPHRYTVTLILSVDGVPVDSATRGVGFRALTVGDDVDRNGLQLELNGVPLFARGAVWVPAELAGSAPGPEETRRRLEAVRAAGMNMVRIPGTACYESDAFHDLCDELGILVWQDFMFANMDYPETDAAFMRTVEDEVRQVLGRIAWRPSVAVLCGGSEVAQQVAMLGLDPELARGPLYGDLLPALVAESRTDAVYIPSTPWGGDLPFRTDHGVAHYFGVGAYLRPLEDARRSQVKFASECLAFANVPEDAADDPIGAGGFGPQDPGWKSGVPRDAGAGWDFEDVRDHYLAELFDVDPVRLRAQDIDRYLELSRVTTAEVMAETFGEWRRRSSSCGGALVLWLSDLRPGAGWGLLDHRGRPKLAYHFLARALAPVAVWSTDAGLGGVVAHVANDRPDPLTAKLRVALYRDRELRVAEASADIELGGHSVCEHNVEELLGRFVDVSWSYRFGPPPQDLVVLSLEGAGEDEGRPLSQVFRHPAGRPTATERSAALGLTARTERDSDGGWSVCLTSRRFVYGCRIAIPGWLPEDNGFSLEPGHPRLVRLAMADPSDDPAGDLTAVNLDGRIRIVSGVAA
ncbi:MAG: hypothetical protein WAU75_04580 [Solirubrobacteraceae bacterium]